MFNKEAIWQFYSATEFLPQWVKSYAKLQNLIPLLWFRGIFFRKQKISNVLLITLNKAKEIFSMTGKYISYLQNLSKPTGREFNASFAIYTLYCRADNNDINARFNHRWKILMIKKWFHLSSRFFFFFLALYRINEKCMIHFHQFCAISLTCSINITKEKPTSTSDCLHYYKAILEQPNKLQPTLPNQLYLHN